MELRSGAIRDRDMARRGHKEKVEREMREEGCIWKTE